MRVVGLVGRWQLGARARRAATHALVVLVVWLGVLSSSTVARAVDIHTLLDSKCRHVSGVIVRVDETRVRLIDLGGHSVTWPRDKIASVVLHKPLDNPIPFIVLDDALRDGLFDVYLSSGKEPAFTGWPVQFIEELVVFYDLQGRTHVLDLEDIHRMRRPVPRAGVRLEYAPVTLDFPVDYVHCPGLQNPAGLPPSRIIGDRVKVSDYFDTFATRYLELDSFRERTYLYAKPFLFDERTRLGFLYMRRRGPVIPVYIHWSTGRPYAFQSFLLLGGAPVPWLPTVDPEVVIWSDLKSHVFHATFLANPFAIPAGTETFGGEPVSPRGGDRHTEALFNYLILMGADYGPWSASVGTYYPSRFVRILPIETEINARRAALVFRARAVFERVSLNAMYFRNRQHRAFSMDDQDMFEGRQVDEYELNEDTVRLGVVAEAFDTRGTLDAVLVLGRYEETPTFDLEFRHIQFGSTLSREFGHYVRMNLHVNYHIEKNDFSSVMLQDSSETRRRFDYGGAFEFQF